MPLCLNLILTHSYITHLQVNFNPNRPLAFETIFDLWQIARTLACGMTHVKVLFSLEANLTVETSVDLMSIAGDNSLGTPLP